MKKPSEAEELAAELIRRAVARQTFSGYFNWPTFAHKYPKRSTFVSALKWLERHGWTVTAKGGGYYSITMGEMES